MIVSAPGSAEPPDEASATRVAVPRKEPTTKYGGSADPGPQGEPGNSAHSALQMLAVAPATAALCALIARCFRVHAATIIV